MDDWVQSIDVGLGLPLPGADPFGGWEEESRTGQASTPPEWAVGQEDWVRPGPLMPESAQRPPVPLDTPTSPVYDRPVSQIFDELEPPDPILPPSLPARDEPKEVEPPSVVAAPPRAPDPPQAVDTLETSADTPAVPDTVASIPREPPSLPLSPVGEPSPPPGAIESSVTESPAPPEPVVSPLPSGPPPVPSQQTGEPPAPLSPEQVRERAVETRRERREGLRTWRREAAGLPPETPPRAGQEADAPTGEGGPPPRPTPLERHEEGLARRQAGRPPNESELRRLIEEQGDPFERMGGGAGWGGEDTGWTGGSPAGGSGASAGGSLQELLQELRGLREEQKEANSLLAAIAEEISSVGTVGP